MKIGSLQSAFMMLFLSMSLGFVQTAYADDDFLGDTGPVHIEEIGCFLYEATCFFSLESK